MRILPLSHHTVMMKEVLSQTHLSLLFHLVVQEKLSFLTCPLVPEGNSREPVSWSSEEISVSRGNFLGKMQSVHEARVVRSTGSELREGGRDGVGGCEE